MGAQTSTQPLCTQLCRVIKESCAWVCLASKEFWLPFRHWRHCPGGRDFFWLTALLVLVFIFALLLWGSKEGLTNRFVDVLIGNVPGHGIPVLVKHNPYNLRRLDRIGEGTAEQVAQLKEDKIPGLSFHPYAEVAGLRMPGEGLWHEKEQDIPAFAGLAVYEDDPLWRYAVSDNGTPALYMAASRSLMKKYFRYAIYLKRLKERLPVPLWEALPSEKSFYASEHGKLWLNVGVSETELLPVRFKWMDRLPIPGDFVYLFPIKTYRALTLTHFYPKLRYFPESVKAAGKDGGVRYREARLNKELDARKVEAFAACMKIENGITAEELRGRRNDFLIKFKKFALPPRPGFLIRACAKQSGIASAACKPANPAVGDAFREIEEEAPVSCLRWPQTLLRSKEERTICAKVIEVYRATGSIQDEFISRKLPSVELPCSKVPELLTEKERKECDGNSRFPVNKRVFMLEGLEFTRGFIYVPGRSLLGKTVKELRKLEGRPLAVGTLYENSLRRFSALSNILDKLSNPYALTFIVFLAILIWVQLATLIEHRRQVYGIFLAKGMSGRYIHYMLYFQTFLATLLGFGAAGVVFTCMRVWLEQSFSSVVRQFNDVLTDDGLGLLPLSWQEYGMIFVTVLATAWISIWVLLFIMPLRKNTTPASLLKD
ncbi:MAG: ABC transporter permease [Gammaproteobacteria bacterium]|nr:ABC transporter permease [Gammaproteobacteria bacterium]